MSYFDVVLETLQGIQKELKATRHAILHQTKLLQESKETPKEAAPAPKEITWQEAARYLRDYCKSLTQAECQAGACPMYRFCERYLSCGSEPERWEVPANE